MDLKGKQDSSQFLGANQPHWGSKVYPALVAWMWYGEQKVVASVYRKCVPPGGRPEATPECPSYGQFLPAGRIKEKKSWCPKQEG